MQEQFWKQLGTWEQQLLGAANWPSSRAGSHGGHTTGAVKEGEEVGKTTPSLPNAAGKGIAFLSTTATEAAWLWLMPPAQPPPSKHAPSVSWLCGPSSKRCSDFCSPATGLRGA